MLEEYVAPKTDLTLYRLAKEADLSYPMLSKLKAGHKQSMNTESLDKIIKALRHITGKQITPNDLLEYVEDVPKETPKKSKSKK
jgi:DNA-binding Xre family transcriptional regulator